MSVSSQLRTDLEKLQERAAQMLEVQIQLMEKAINLTPQQRLIFNEPFQPHEHDDEFMITGLEYDERPELDELSMEASSTSGVQYLVHFDVAQIAHLIERLETGAYTIQDKPQQR